MDQNPIKYVEVIVSEIRNKEPKKGLLLGLVIKETAALDLVSILLPSKVTLHCNLSYFNITEINVRKQVSSSCRLFIGTVSEQNNALEFLKELILKLREEGRASAAGDVFVNKYVDTPEIYSRKGSLPSFSVPRDTIETTTANDSTTTVNPPKVITVTDLKKVTVLKRITKKPTAKRLENTKKKVFEIAIGTFVQKTFPIIAKDDEPVEVPSRASAFREEYADMGDMYGEGYYGY